MSDEPDDRIVLANLPALTAEELDELHVAVAAQMYALARMRTRSAPEILAVLERKGRVLQSLDTAVVEARLSLDRGLR
jgi:hypothetical protein